MVAYPEIAPAAGSQTLLLAVPSAELRSVRGEVQELLGMGEFSIGSDDSGPGVARIVAALGGTTWELRPDSQSLKVGEASYILSGPEPGTFYALSLAADADPEAVGILEAVLENVTLYKESERLLNDPAAQRGEAVIAQQVYRSRLAQGVHKTSAAIAHGLMVTATKASGALQRRPSEQTVANPVRIPEGLKKRFAQTASLAGWLSKVAEGAVSILGSVGGALVTPVLWFFGANKPLKPGEDPGRLRETAHAAASGFTQVWDSMELAGYTVLTTARDSTAGAIGDKYGADAAEVSLHSMNAAGSTANAALSVRKIGVKTVAKAAAKKTAKGVITNWSGGASTGGQAAGPAPASASPAAKA